MDINVSNIRIEIMSRYKDNIYFEVSCSTLNIYNQLNFSSKRLIHAGKPIYENLKSCDKAFIETHFIKARHL